MGLVPTKSSIKSKDLITEENLITRMRKKTTNLIQLFTLPVNSTCFTNLELVGDVLGIIINEFTHGHKGSEQMGGNWRWNLNTGISCRCEISLTIAYCDLLPLWSFSMVSKKHRTMALEHFQKEIKLMPVLVGLMNEVLGRYHLSVTDRKNGDVIKRPVSFGLYDEETVHYIYSHYINHFLVYIEPQ